MNWWQRIKAWFAPPNQSEEPTLIPDGTQPIPSDLFVPGESQRINAPKDDKWNQTQAKR